MLKDKVTKLNQKTEDLEGRQRRCNIQILRIKEKFEAGSRRTHSMAKLLQKTLRLDTTPTLDQADLSLQPEPARGHQPIVKLLYYQEKLEVLRRVARVSPLTYNDNVLAPTVVKRRATFKEVKELLHRCQDV